MVTQFVTIPYNGKLRAALAKVEGEKILEVYLLPEWVDLVPIIHKPKGNLQ